ncbi:MAG: DUF5067 domain-containing protein [Ruminococcaceae bacterium]|nr:DUF5067 domain-containing protein [Oscillospiraceae bacterium]
MKKILALLLALLMLFTLCACGKDDTTDKPDSDPTAETPDVKEDPKKEEPAKDEPAKEDPADEEPKEEEPPVEEEENPLSYTFTQYGNAKITIVGAEFTEDDWGDPVMRIYYDYTNTGDIAVDQCPSLALDYKSVTQDGEECGRTYFSMYDSCVIPEDLMNDCNVQPGCTARNTMLIECDPEGGPVEVSCYIMSGNWVYEEDTVELFTFQMDPKDLPGAPEPYELPAILNPTYATGLSAAGSNEKSEISIDGMELTQGDEGESVLRVNLTVTNNGEDAEMPMSITNGVEAYQDGVSLVWFSSWDLDATDGDYAYEEDLYPGETVQCSALFLLRNDHPVEIVIEDMYDDMRLGMIGDIKGAMEAMQALLEEQQQAALAAEAEARKALVGTWLQRDSDWDDTFIFNADGSGMLISGPEYPYTYKISDDVLTLIYGLDDEEEFTFSVDGDVLTMIDMWGDELVLDRQAE